MRAVMETHMTVPEQDATQEGPRLPDGFLFVSLDQVLVMLAMTIVFVGMLAEQPYPVITACILGPVVFILFVSSFVAMRQVRKFVRKHGNVEIIVTFSCDASDRGKNILRKDILIRRAGDSIDDGIDPVIDGKGQEHP